MALVHYDGGKTRDDLLQEITKTEYALVDFFATWCGPCRALGPVLEEMQNEVDYNIIKVDIDNYPELAAFYGVRSIPTLLVFKGSDVLETLVGGRDKEQLKNEVKKVIER